ncbi:hypothetical protein BC941DRAFT_358428 [Chlamydoabsidia padenii]|nr:hypothetical protein BC941DRAFT_358428 [Chlamydoabsidia padenii]
MSSSPSIRSITRLGSLSSLPTPSSSTSTSSSSTFTFGLKKSSTSSSQQLQEANATLYSDIAQVRQAMDLFLNSRIPECEAILNPRRDSSMYHSLGYAFVLFLKACMTFQKEDIEAGLEAMKQAYQMADKLRKRDSSWKNLSAWVKSHSVQDIQNMTPLQRHAELVYAETYLLKAMLQIIYDESFVGFLREGLKMRTSHGIYKVLEKYMLHVQEEASLGKDVTEYGLDEHFASGIAFGMGCFNLVLSMLPNIVLKLAEFVGFTGDRDVAMFYFRSVGGWDDLPPGALDRDELPEQQGPEEGLRRQFCDMMLLLYNIVLSKLAPLSHVDEPLADAVLKYNLTLYPDGIFFLYFSGRQLSSKKQLDQAKEQYHRAISMESSWKQLHHICYWELGLISLLQQDWKLAQQHYALLNQESNWSKAVYTYVQGLSLYMFALELAPGDKRSQLLGKVNELMTRVTKAKQKIAGKSIFVEKFVARKSRKFELQGSRLLFPDLEVLNAFSAFELMSTDLARKNLARIDATLVRLQNNNSFYVYDDLCLCHFLRTMLIRMILQDTSDNNNKELKQAHQVSVQAVMDFADKVQLDHYTYYFTVYEKARMLIMDNQLDAAQKEINYLIRCSEKNDFNVGAGARAKNKYSLENSLILKCHNCLEMITEMQQNELQHKVQNQLVLESPTNNSDDSDDEFEDAKEE